MSKGKLSSLSVTFIHTFLTYTAIHLSPGHWGHCAGFLERFHVESQREKGTLLKITKAKEILFKINSVYPSMFLFNEISFFWKGTDYLWLFRYWSIYQKKIWLWASHNGKWPLSFYHIKLLVKILSQLPIFSLQSFSLFSTFQLVGYQGGRLIIAFTACQSPSPKGSLSAKALILAGQLIKRWVLLVLYRPRQARLSWCYHTILSILTDVQIQLSYRYELTPDGQPRSWWWATLSPLY